MGIEHVAIFGSTARDEATATSDLDLFVTFRHDVRLGWDYVDLDERIGQLLGVPVDVISDPDRRPRLKAAIERDRVDAF
ncbi:nucleotidyltransferase domain-containing protein [Sphingomonas sp. HHU CXW]|uniref:Nucleotidyltransferase domain-containing protein n=1 Tax=Sphingomonas hominis TaxID=2741495 RepID=A0ABX2JNF5_9SPHN|nr:nucleotidyltransferase domain-containing protein [Sphingomonas hominis]NTS64632.1 nucleotidyltransferase domain-containing protein [Sphingomonas hominis]